VYASYEYNATGGAATSSVNSIISQTTDNFSQGEIDWGVVRQASIVGGVSGAAGYVAGGWASKHLGDLVLNNVRIGSPMLSYGIKGAVGGAAGGWSGGFSAGLIMTGDWNEAWKMAYEGALTGGIVGAGLGIGEGYHHAKTNHQTLWNAKTDIDDHMIMLPSEDPIIVTPDGVALPSGTNIPSEYIENPYRQGSYGIEENNIFVEKMRIDPATPPGKRGPNVSHFHLNGKRRHYYNLDKWPK